MKRTDDTTPPVLPLWQKGVTSSPIREAWNRWLDVFVQSNLWWAWLLPMAAMALSLWLWRVATVDIAQTAREHFTFRQTEILHAISDRMAAYEQVLRGALGLMIASTSVTRDEWRDYVQALQIEQRYPGLQGIGYSTWILPIDAAAYVAAIQAEGFEDFTIRPPGERAEYTSITYLEPFDRRNRQAFGYDMWSETVRRTAMKAARDTGTTRISGKVTLVQEIDTNVQAGMLMYLPHYKPGMPVEMPEQRQAALQGFVHSPFRMGDLMAGILGSRLPDVRLEIFDGAAMTPETLLYDSAADKTLRTPRQALTETTVLMLHGHPWQVRLTTLAAFHAGLDESRPLVLLLAGNVISLLCGVIVWLFVTMRRRALLLAQKMTQTLNQHAAALAKSNADLETFAYIASHDLKAPLRGIDNLATWISEDLGEALQGDSREYMTLLRGRVHRLDRLLEDLLQYSRVGRVEVQVEAVDVEQLVTGIFSLLNTAPAFTLVLPGPLPTLQTVRSRLEQVFSNLISNALKYHDKAAGQLQVSVQDIGDFYEFAVADDGPGIDPAYHAKVFQMFQRLQARDEIEGSGMGLAIIKKVIEEQGGAIWVEYTADRRGATFRFHWAKQPQGEKNADLATSHLFAC